MKNTNKVIYLLIVLTFMGCNGKMDTKPIKIDQIILSMDAEIIEVLSSKKIFFGHKSVGFNIISGLEKIIEQNDRLNILNIEELSADDNLFEAGIYHARNGDNNFPKTKCDAFGNFLREKNRGKLLDIAFFKFCYVDIEKSTDIKKLFDYYVATMEQIKTEFPDLKIIHVTSPLAAHAWGLKGFIKNILKGDGANVKRNQFNELLMQKYKNIDSIYDLAGIESTLPDGTRESFTHEGKVIYSLHKNYTYDGGHLNETGQFYAAKELLQILTEDFSDK